MKIIYKNPFKESFYMVSCDVWSDETVQLVHCKECQQISEALVRIFNQKQKYYCPICKKRTNQKYEKALYVSPIYAKVFDDEHKITYSCAFHHHLLKFDFQKRKMRKISVVYRYNITHNKQSKQTYLIRKYQNPKNNRIANITFGAFPFKWKLLKEHLRYMEQEKAFQCFLRQLFPSWFSAYERLKIMQFPILLRYPQLALLPLELTEHSDFRFQLRDHQQKRKQLEQLPQKQNELIEWLLNAHVSKKERKMLYESPHLIVIYKHLTHIFVNTDVKQYMLEELAHLSCLKRFDFQYLPMEHLFEQLNPEYINEFDVVKNYFRNEKRFAIAIVKQIESNKDYIFEYIRDIVRMIEVVQKEIPTYEVPKLSDLEKLHDLLASDLNKLEMEYEEIMYSKEEIMKFETETKNHRFLLATSNHHLIEVGTQLNICVGSYAPEAIDKGLYIVLMEDKEQEKVTHCLELHCKGKQWSLVQAKGKYNDVPSEEISRILIDYCAERKIRISTHDIDFETVLELTS
ncbi:PcfJ domain-containing protein [Bacillus mycoides]|uniref:PcfJ-like protein n=1 Tax=Bacillus mycoides TaxID=1405 RepID=A0ABC9QV75_BACMY|nr:PcfJ domain-containing protein [Bacillus mycoides]EJR28898.1 hypothetical protein III_06004 [Bacillus mycoides]